MDAPRDEFLELPDRLPLLPLRNKVLLPHSVIRVSLSSPEGIALVEQNLGPGRTNVIGVVPVKEPEDDASGADSGVPTPSLQFGAADVADTLPSLHACGVAASVINIGRAEAPRRVYTLLLEGRCRFSVASIVEHKPFLHARVASMDLPRSEVASLNQDGEFAELSAKFQEAVLKLIELVEPGLEARTGKAGDVSAATRLRALLQRAPAHLLADVFSASFLPVLSRAQQLQLLYVACPKQRLRMAVELIHEHLDQYRSHAVASDISKKVGDSISKSQREFLLRQQLKAIKEELGEGEDKMEEDDLGSLKKRLLDAQLPEEAAAVAERELKKLRRMSEQQPGYSSVREHLEWMADLPWSRETPPEPEEGGPGGRLLRAREVLDKAHHGLHKAKARVVEYLAVQQLRREGRPPVLCFAGPPGVGKTSLARSVAEVLGRPFQRISLGGVRDEADIRGHRRTYVGSMPGRIVQGLKRAGVRDAVFLLDEIDKVGGGDARGDPSAALLEVLDPEQNHGFVDHYLHVPFNLSRAVFLATANDLRGVPPPLLDRMEVIHIGGYTHEEKLHIAVSHIVPRQLKDHGLTLDQLQFTEDVLNYIIQGYTREAGVRGLERNVAAICRAAAVHVAAEPDTNSPAVFPIRPDEQMIEKVLGPVRFLGTDVADRIDTPGVVAGLAWTAVGGDLMFIECSRMSGRGGLVLTGQLGDVIKESAQIALSWVRQNARGLGIKDAAAELATTDLHIHLPDGAVPKDGPSAGVAMAIAIVSLLSSMTVPKDMAMTGEVTLQGHVLPVGGLKEKLIAAHRSGVKRVLVPARNMPDVRYNVPSSVLNVLQVIPVRRMEEVVQAVFPDACHGLPTRARL